MMVFDKKSWLAITTCALLTGVGTSAMAGKRNDKEPQYDTANIMKTINGTLLSTVDNPCVRYTPTHIPKGHPDICFMVLHIEPKEGEQPGEVPAQNVGVAFAFDKGLNDLKQDYQQIAQDLKDGKSVTVKQHHIHMMLWTVSPSDDAKDTQTSQTPSDSQQQISHRVINVEVAIAGSPSGTPSVTVEVSPNDGSASQDHKGGKHRPAKDTATQNATQHIRRQIILAVIDAGKDIIPAALVLAIKNHPIIAPDTHGDNTSSRPSDTPDGTNPMVTSTNGPLLTLTPGPLKPSFASYSAGEIKVLVHSDKPVKISNDFIKKIQVEGGSGEQFIQIQPLEKKQKKRNATTAGTDFVLTVHSKEIGRPVDVTLLPGFLLDSQDSTPSQTASLKGLVNSPCAPATAGENLPVVNVLYRKSDKDCVPVSINNGKTNYTFSSPSITELIDGYDFKSDKSCQLYHGASHISTTLPNLDKSVFFMEKDSSLILANSTGQNGLIFLKEGSHLTDNTGTSPTTSWLQNTNIVCEAGAYLEVILNSVQFKQVRRVKSVNYGNLPINQAPLKDSTNSNE